MWAKGLDALCNYVTHITSNHYLTSCFTNTNTYSCYCIYTLRLFTSASDASDVKKTTIAQYWNIIRHDTWLIYHGHIATHGVLTLSGYHIHSLKTCFQYLFIQLFKTCSWDF